MKNYLSEIIDLTGDSQLNPTWTGHTRKVNTITSISIHHDAQVRPHDYDSVARYREEARYQNSTSIPGSKGIMYHYKIDNVGQIFKLRPHETWLWTVGSDENTSTLAICLDGYFHPPHNQVPTREQYEALSQLLVNLCEEHPEFPATYPDVRPHRNFSATACPGDLFAPWVYNVESKANVLDIPTAVTYDWPEYQTDCKARRLCTTCPYTFT
jgi:N-acetyl-anhydromuramyl-L-alanine amidase AmpD